MLPQADDAFPEGEVEEVVGRVSASDGGLLLYRGSEPVANTPRPSSAHPVSSVPKEPRPRAMIANCSLLYPSISSKEAPKDPVSAVPFGPVGCASISKSRFPPNMNPSTGRSSGFSTPRQGRRRHSRGKERNYVINKYNMHTRINPREVWVSA